MWNSPSKESKIGKRYSLEDLSVLLLPLSELLPNSRALPMAEIVGEEILQRFERDELVFALYQVFDALLGETKIPEGGHPGFQEALIYELLQQAHAMVCCEMDDPESGSEIRKTVWKFIDRYMTEPAHDSSSLQWILEEARVDLKAPEPFLSEQLDYDEWENLLVNEGGLFDEFLWDVDWRTGEFMDLPLEVSKPITQTLGLDLDVVQALPHSPSPSELKMAEQYLSNLISRAAALDKRPSGE